MERPRRIGASLVGKGLTASVQGIVIATTRFMAQHIDSV